MIRGWNHDELNKSTEFLILLRLNDQLETSKLDNRKVSWANCQYWVGLWLMPPWRSITRHRYIQANCNQHEKTGFSKLLYFWTNDFRWVIIKFVNPWFFLHSEIPRKWTLFPIKLKQISNSRFRRDFWNTIRYNTSITALSSRLFKAMKFFRNFSKISNFLPIKCTWVYQHNPWTWKS